MIVEEIMTIDLVTIKESDSLRRAQELMVEKSIRHLPVVNKKKLLGIITESDIRGAFVFNDSPKEGKLVNFDPSKMPVKDYMTRDPLTVTPDTNIEDAALVIYRNKIGGLPVVQNGKLEGVVTILDMLGLFIDMMSLLESSSRIDVLVDKNQKSIDKVTGIITGHGLEIISTGIEPYEDDPKKQVCCFRMDLCETARVVKDIEKAGFKVLDAID